MHLLLLTLALVGHVLAQVPGLGFGPYYMMQRTSSHLVEYSTIMRAPKAPDTQRGVVAVWPGINTDARPTNLIQTILSGGTVRSLVLFPPSALFVFNMRCSIACLGAGFLRVAFLA